MDVTTKAIALRATDYKENDKLVLLYSLEYGKISVYARGIRKGSAKLKFCADQFCFGQYELACTADRFTLKTCEQLESFYSLREDIVTYYAGCTIAECLINYTEEGQSEPQIFVETLKALQQLCIGSNPLAVTLRFALEFVRLSGFALDFGKCLACGKAEKKLFLDYARGGLVCEDCRSSDSFAVSPRVSATCKTLDGLSYDKLTSVSVPDSVLKDCLDVVNKYVSHCFSPLKSLTELIKLA